LDAKTTPQGVTIACEFTPGVCAGVVGAEVEWLLGYPEKALASIAGALALAERLAHPFTLSVALIYSSVVHLNRREPERALRQVAAVSRWIKAFQFYGGVSRRGIYDSMKTAVEAIFVGKARQYNRRFLQMCSHHLVEPVACTPAAGWEKGQVENQVGNLRDRLFLPKPRVKSLAELNA
jgi:transposase